MEARGTLGAGTAAPSGRYWSILFWPLSSGNWESGTTRRQKLVRRAGTTTVCRRAWRTARVGHHLDAVVGLENVDVVLSELFGVD